MVEWRKDVLVLYKINEYIAEMGENYESIMDYYFDAFKEKMNNRFRIPQKLWKITKMIYVSWWIVTKCTFRKCNPQLYGWAFARSWSTKLWP